MVVTWHGLARALDSGLIGCFGNDLRRFGSCLVCFDRVLVRVTRLAVTCQTRLATVFGGRDDMLAVAVSIINLWREDMLNLLMPGYLPWTLFLSGKSTSK